jgi:hypothetical protein
LGIGAIRRTLYKKDSAFSFEFEMAPGLGLRATQQHSKLTKIDDIRTRFPKLEGKEEEGQSEGS